jgi:integrase
VVAIGFLMKNNTHKAPVHVERLRDMSVNIYYAPSRGYESYAMTYYSGGKRRVSRANSLEAAKTKAKSIIQQITAGSGRIAILNPMQVIDYLEATKTVRALGLSRLVDMTEDYAAARGLLPAGSTLRAAAAEYRKVHDRKAKLAAVTVSDLIAKLVAAKEAERLSWRYCADVKTRLKPFGQAFKCQIGSVMASEIIEWLDRMKVTGRTRNNYRKMIITLFRYARTMGHLPRNEVTEAELVPVAKPKPTPIGIYTPDELEMIMRVTPDRLRPSVAIAAFAGIRSHEILRLDWQDVNMEQGHIVVSASKAKTASRRLVPIVPALRAWLERRKEQERKGLIAPGFSQPQSWNRSVGYGIERHNKAAKATGAPVIPRVHNGLRHSFASYRLAILKNAAEVSLEMGNSPQKLFANYRELVTESEAQRWFAVMPADG